MPGPGRARRRRRELRLFHSRRLAAVVSRDLGLHRDDLLSARPRPRPPRITGGRCASSAGCSRSRTRDGSFANPRYGSEGIVFDTGQVLFALVRGHELTGDAANCSAAALRAARMARRASPTPTAAGRATSTSDTPHVYNTRTAWALLRLNEVDRDRRSAKRSRAPTSTGRSPSSTPSGCFEHCAFRAGRAPFTHTIAYTARGLLESGLLLAMSAVTSTRPSAAPMRCFRSMRRRRPPALDDRDRRPRDGVSSCCLTGNCQFAIVWARLHAASAPEPAIGSGDRAARSTT